MLHVGDQGDEVAKLHQALAERGLPAPKLEVTGSYFGPGTLGAVKDFQAKHCLKVDGVVGEKTWAALQSLVDQGPTTSPLLQLDHLSPFVAKLLSIADREYRKPVLEQPPGSNRGLYVDMYLVGHRGDGIYLRDFNLQPNGTYFGAPWCSRFALWCVEEAAMQLGVETPTAGWGDLASANKWRGKALTAGCFSQVPVPGAVGCILTSEGRGHVVLVGDADPEGALTCIEGNSGGLVNIRTRKVEEFAGFVHLKEPGVG
jgi:hypothetical protein